MVTHTPSCGSALRRRKRSIEPDDVVDTTVLTYATDFDETAVFNVRIKFNFPRQNLKTKP